MATKVYLILTKFSETGLSTYILIHYTYPCGAERGGCQWYADCHALHSLPSIFGLVSFRESNLTVL